MTEINWVMPANLEFCQAFAVDSSAVKWGPLKFGHAWMAGTEHQWHRCFLAPDHPGRHRCRCENGGSGG